jgi:hypothetical protein
VYLSGCAEVEICTAGKRYKLKDASLRSAEVGDKLLEIFRG